MNNILTIVVTQHWFNKILSGEKKEDFREIKKHWNSRLVLPQFQSLSTTNLYFPPVFDKGQIVSRNYDSPHQVLGMAIAIDFRKYDLVKMVVGYQKDRDELISEFKGIRITHSSEETDLGKGNFFAIGLGEIIKGKL